MAHIQGPTPFSMRQFASYLLGLCLLGTACTKHESSPSKAAAAEKPAMPTPLPEKQPTDEELRAFLLSLPVSSIGIGMYTQPEMMASGQQPKVGTIFNLNFMQVVQKVPDGYFLQWTPPGEGPSGELVFLETQAVLAENARFLSGGYWAVFTGTSGREWIRADSLSVLDAQQHADQSAA
jgi:hypothetical protein